MLKEGVIEDRVLLAVRVKLELAGSAVYLYYLVGAKVLAIELLA